MADEDIVMESADNIPLSVTSPQVASKSSIVHVLTMSWFMLMQATPTDIAKFVNQEIFDQLIAKSANVETSVQRPEEVKVMVDEDEDDVKTIRDGELDNLRFVLRWVIKKCYLVPSAVSYEVAESVAKKADEKFRVKNDHMKKAFTETVYVGDALVQFDKYLWRRYKAPYVAVVQNSGFGKSRMLSSLLAWPKLAKAHVPTK